MKVIEIQELKNFGGCVYRVSNRSDFESVVDIAGHYQQVIDDNEAAEEFGEGLSDYIYSRLSDSIELYVENLDSSATVLAIIDDVVNNVEIPEEVRSYSFDVYVELDTKCKSLFFVEGTKPDYEELYDALFDSLNKTITKLVDKAIADYKANQIAKEVKERERQTLISETREAYSSASTQTKKNEIVGQLKVKLTKEFGEKNSKDDIIYMLEN